MYFCDSAQKKEKGKLTTYNVMHLLHQVRLTKSAIWNENENVQPHSKHFKIFTSGFYQLYGKNFWVQYVYDFQLLCTNTSTCLGWTPTSYVRVPLGWTGWDFLLLLSFPVFSMDTASKSTDDSGQNINTGWHHTRHITPWHTTTSSGSPTPAVG